MKAVRACIAFLLTVCILFCAIWIAAGASVSAVFSANTIDALLEGLDLSDAVSSAMGGDTDGMDELFLSLLETGAVRYYINDFAQDYIRAVLYGETMPVITSDGLEPVLDAGLDELENSGSLTDLEALTVEGLRLATPQLADSLASQVQSFLPSRAQLLGQIGLTEDAFDSLVYLIGSTVRAILTGIAVFLAFLVLLLCRKRCRWAGWLGTAALIPGIGCIVGAFALSSSVSSALSSYGLESMAKILMAPFLLRGAVLLAIAIALYILRGACGTGDSAPAPAAEAPEYVPKHRK